MPDAHEHDAATLLLTATAGITASSIDCLTSGYLIAAGIFVGGIFLSPDLDHDVGARPYRRWGPLRFLWYPYQRFVPHRSIISHAPLLGTLIRVGYLACWLAGALALMHASGVLPLPAVGEWMFTHMWHVGIVIAGVELASIVHIVQDMTG